MAVRTESILVQTLCVPCACRCRYCLLSWDGRAVGADYERSAAYARRFHRWLRENRPGLRFHFSFGYSMEHPDLPGAIDFMRATGSAGAAFLQCDGMRARDEAELAALMETLVSHGVAELNYTFYGDAAYHDRFAARPGDHALMLRAIAAAKAAGLRVSARMPLTRESADMAEGVLDAVAAAGADDARLFIPHAEGRGAVLEPIRLTRGEFDALPARVRARLNQDIYRAEAEWLADPPPPETRRMLLLSLTPENIETFERLSFDAAIARLEALDDAYYAAIPPFDALSARYGDPHGDRLFSRRDLFQCYQKRFIAENGLHLHDVTDERQCGSRRY